MLSTVAVTSLNAYIFLSATAIDAVWPHTAILCSFTESTNFLESISIENPGIASNLSKVPPVCPRPLPDIFATGAPQAATNGANAIVVLSPTPPVLFLTARSEEVDRLLGLEIGADDYVAKPFSPREVCARVRTLLRRVKKFSSPSPVIRIGHFELNEPAAQISWFDTPLTLTRYEFLLLKTLLKSPGRVWSRQQLMDSVWEDAQDTYDRTVDTHIKTLRAKLRAINPDLSPINTHRGMGYSLRGL